MFEGRYCEAITLTKPLEILGVGHSADIIVECSEPRPTLWAWSEMNLLMTEAHRSQHPFPPALPPHIVPPLPCTVQLPSAAAAPGRLTRMQPDRAQFGKVSNITLRQSCTDELGQPAVKAEGGSFCLDGCNVVSVGGAPPPRRPMFRPTASH